MQEIWKKADGYDLEVSNLGRLRAKTALNGKAIKEYRILTPTDNGNGYLRINRTIDGKQKTLYVHKLVARAFVDNPNGLTEINHLDENKQNNNADNLAWCTHKENCGHGTRNERAGEKHSKPIVCVETGIIYKSVTEAAKCMRCVKTAITNCLNKRTKTSCGYHWEYVDAI
jgi:hypothetical protein